MTTTTIVNLVYARSYPVLSDSGLSTGAKAGIGAGAGVGALVILGGLTYLVVKYRKRKNDERASYGAGYGVNVAEIHGRY